MKRARAPGKIILSGEHAVVYGAPAIVCAIRRYTTVGFAPLHRSRTIRTALTGISAGKHYRTAALQRLKEKLDQRFEQYSRGERAVQNILHRPDDLVIYSLATLFQHLPLPGFSENRHLPVPGRLSSQSELPLGAGMGSSAAAIAATLGDGWYWILSGIPAVSTGESVAHVRKQHGHDVSLWQQFAATTTALQTALTTGADPRPALRENHRLLTHIGVVPAPAAALIRDIETAGGAAKISGAGAHRGDGGGIILAYHPDPQAIPALLAPCPALLWDALHPAERGAHLLEDNDAPA